MPTSKLSEALREARARLIDERHKHEDTKLRCALSDGAEFAAVLARIAEGQDMRRAFGAPGDWGYDTAIGQCLFALFSHPPELSEDEQQTLMICDPATSEPKPYPSHAAQWRDYHGKTAWLFNPWTGGRRDARDVGSDTFGHLIIPPSEPIYAIRGAA